MAAGAVLNVFTRPDDARNHASMRELQAARGALLHELNFPAPLAFCGLRSLVLVRRVIGHGVHVAPTLQKGCLQLCVRFHIVC